MSSFKNLLQNHWANFKQTYLKSSLEEGIEVSNEGKGPSPR
jgi:hypothetical protein